MCNNQKKYDRRCISRTAGPMSPKDQDCFLYDISIWIVTFYVPKGPICAELCKYSDTRPTEAHYSPHTDEVH